MLASQGLLVLHICPPVAFKLVVGPGDTFFNVADCFVGFLNSKFVAFFYKININCSLERSLTALKRYTWICFLHWSVSLPHKPLTLEQFSKQTSISEYGTTQHRSATPTDFAYPHGGIFLGGLVWTNLEILVWLRSWQPMEDVYVGHGCMAHSWFLPSGTSTN